MVIARPHFTLSPLHKGSDSIPGRAAWHNVQQQTYEKPTSTSVRLVYRHINFHNGSRRPSRGRTGLTTDLAMGPQLPGCRRLLGPHDTFHAPGSGDTRQATKTATTVSSV